MSCVGGAAYRLPLIFCKELPSGHVYKMHFSRTIQSTSQFPTYRFPLPSPRACSQRAKRGCYFRESTPSCFLSVTQIETWCCILSWKHRMQCIFQAQVSDRCREQVHNASTYLHQKLSKVFQDQDYWTRRHQAQQCLSTVLITVHLCSFRTMHKYPYEKILSCPSEDDKRGLRQLLQPPLLFHQLLIPLM